MNKHEACPNCPSSDAYWVYPDGHGYCFSCKTPTFPTTRASVERAIQAKNVGSQNTDSTQGSSGGLTTVIDSSSWTSRLPSVALAWLSKYGITANEIKENDIYWDTSSSGLVFVIDWICSNDGKAPSVTSTRYFSSDRKYRTQGKKQNSKKIWGTPNEKLILCEDVLSAIKIGRTSNAKALLGTSPNYAFLVSQAKNYDRIDVWLDPDKRMDSITISNTLKQYGIKSEPIFSKNDPKTDIT